MKFYNSILFFILISFVGKAQQVQVTTLDSCLGVQTKAAIVLNSGPMVANAIGTNLNLNTFNFNLTTASTTSAGVYNSTGNLIYTLWSGVKYSAGKYSVKWDGIIDDGTQAPPGVYTAKVLSNNVTYDWLGVIGNTSASHTANQFLTPFYGMASANGHIFTAGGYSERDIKTNKFALNNIGSFLYALDPSQNVTQTMSAYHACTNGTSVFWAGGDPYSSAKSFIFASNPADDSQVHFTNGQTVTIGIDGRQYHSAFITSTTIGNINTGIAANTNFLYAPRNDGNLDIFDLRNKSGALLQTMALSDMPGEIACNSTYLWLSLGSNVVQYAIGSNGSLTVTGLSLNVRACNVAMNGNELALTDLDTQQIRFYNASSGATTGILGQAGGYDSNGPLVTNDKFMFYARANGANTPALAYQPDGSFWLSDCGNYRILHFDTDKMFKEKISYVPTSRSCAVDPNDPTKVFADALEYQVDYSKVASDINNSWVLKYNWNVGTNLNVFGQFISVTTLSNNHTYAIGNADAGGIQLYDLRPTGAVQVGTLNFIAPALEPDGSIYSRTTNSNGKIVTTKYPLAGFDGNFMPLWGAGTVLNTVDAPGINNPYDYANNILGASTNPNRYFFYQPNSHPGGSAVVYHLASVKTGQNMAEWMASKSTPDGYPGAYPTNGFYGLGAGHSENCMANINGSNIFWHVNDELGTWTEVARTNHYNEDGLFIGHFGNDNSYEGITGDTRFWAGNSFKTQLAKVGNDLYYFYCDESKHGGVHLVKVSNLASISEQTIPVTLSGPVTLTPDPNSLMAGLPFQGVSLNNATGWTTSTNANEISIKTSVRQFLKDSLDLTVSSGTGDHSVSRYLGNQSLSSYSLTGAISFAGSQNTFPDFNVYSILSLVDKNGKQIAVLYSRSDGIFLNNVNIAPYNGENVNFFQNFSYNYASGILKFKFADYGSVAVTSTWNTGADISSPGKLMISQHVVNYRSDGVSVDLYKLRFVPGS